MAKSAAQKRRREAEAAQENQVVENATQGTPPTKKARVEEARSLFVRSLPPNATAETLTEFFSQHYPVKHATVVLDKETKQSRGYGFVTFADADDAVEAKNKLNNELLEGRRLRLEVAEPRHRAGAKDGANAATSKLAEEKKKREDEQAEARKAPKLIVRNLPWSVKTPEDLTNLFRMHGKVKYADLPSVKGKLKGFGFITMRGRKNAEKAMEAVNGKVVDGRPIAVDWAVDKQTWEQQQKDQPDEPAETEEGAEKPSKDDDDEDKEEEDDEEDEEDADLRNFMKNHMENLEDEESDEEDETGGKVDDDDEEASKETKSLSTDNSTTLFIRNLPFTTTDEDLKSHFGQFGAVRYARVVKDRETDRPAGTGFVCFFNLDDSQACLKSAPRHNPTSLAGKPSILQNEDVDHDGRYTMEGRVLQVAQAVNKNEAERLATTSLALRNEKDKRRLYLLSEGTVARNSPLYNILPESEIKLRETSNMQRKKLVQNNPSLHLSLTRLAVRNIPRNVDSKALKALAREAVVGFAKDVKEGKRQPLSKEENARGGQQDKEAEHRRKEKGKGVVKQAKVVFETKDGSKVSEEIGGKSRGYGFIEYSSHRWALMGLRWLNGHALKNDAGKTSRLIVEFAIENVNVVQRRRAIEDKSRNREATGESKGRDTGAGGPRRGGRDKDDRKGKTGAGRGSRARGEKEKTSEEKVGSKKENKAAAKLAQRQQIIGRKRMMRKKKAQSRGS
ncbi:uncharacterized protein E0L32_012326 [Thyridium curvatum]|uniref:RRM domain-containing protein n=1 Tax=Thyridium curvatum TaxID=1093900 RepID=A0A507BCN9_9PEZI|nr:uncharacterized protein E0L32_012326 [Thyridium curvatum]TPX17016.1 hypothetical protein E0L32_012326 [Thyridium curvatum]